MSDEADTNVVKQSNTESVLRMIEKGSDNMLDALRSTPMDFYRTQSVSTNKLHKYIGPLEAYRTAMIECIEAGCTAPEKAHTLRVLIGNLRKDLSMLAAKSSERLTPDGRKQSTVIEDMLKLRVENISFVDTVQSQKKGIGALFAGRGGGA